MNIYVFSDSHHSTSRMLEVIEKNQNEIDYIIHLGDNEGDVEDIKSSFLKLPVTGVPGNCDTFTRSPFEKTLNYGGKIIYFTHGHIRSVKNSGYEMLTTAKSKKADIALFGHTHVSHLEEKDGILLMNPGSITMPRDGKGYSYGIIEINGENVVGKILTL